MKTTMTNLMIMTFTLFLVSHINVIQSQFDNLPNPSNILLSISTTSSIDDRTAEEIKSVYSSPSITNIISPSSSSSSFTEYFVPGATNQNATEASPLSLLQAINTLHTIKIMIDISKRMNETNQDVNNIAIFGISMKKALDNFFNTSLYPSSPSSSSSSLSSPIISLTPIFIEALDVSPSFNATTNPILSNLTVSYPEQLFELARMIWVSREIKLLLNLTGNNDNSISQDGRDLLNSNLQSFQRILFAINSLTSYQLLDLITEVDFLQIIQAPNVNEDENDGEEGSSEGDESDGEELLAKNVNSASITEYFNSNTISTVEEVSSNLEITQAANTLSVINILIDLDRRISSTNTQFGNDIAIFGASMTATLDNFFDHSDISISLSPSSSFSLASLDILPTFNITGDPILSNLATPYPEELFQLSRMIFISRKIKQLSNNVTIDSNGREVLNNNLQGFQRIFYSINSLTSYQLMDMITEIDFLSVVRASEIQTEKKKK